MLLFYWTYVTREIKDGKWRQCRAKEVVLLLYRTFSIWLKSYWNVIFNLFWCDGINLNNMVMTSCPLDLIVLSISYYIIVNNYFLLLNRWAVTAVVGCTCRTGSNRLSIIIIFAGSRQLSGLISASNCHYRSRWPFTELAFTNLWRPTSSTSPPIAEACLTLWHSPMSHF